MRDEAIRRSKAGQFRFRTGAEVTRDVRDGKTGRPGSPILVGVEIRNGVPFKAYDWKRTAEKRRDAEVARQLEDIREQVARNWNPGRA